MIVGRNAPSLSQYVYAAEDDYEDIVPVQLPLEFFNSGIEGEMDKAIKKIYPDGVYDPNTAVDNVILATTNERVNEWNDLIAKMNPNAEVSLKARSYFNQVDDNHGHLHRMLSDEVLQSYNDPTIPPHDLRLKVDDVCIIVRNLSTKDGITNNTRVRIRQIKKHSIVATILCENPVNITIPRIKFQFRMKYGSSFEMTRVQFPLRRAFALTFNKSQGQTFKRVLLDLRSDVFSHGFLYVAMSRVRRYDDLFVLVSSDRYLDDGPVITNIVYQEALDK